jgi:response regulator NasT
MSKLLISEPEAFSWIQKTAMDRRMGMREVAATVVSGLEGDSPQPRDNKKQVPRNG